MFEREIENILKDNNIEFEKLSWSNEAFIIENVREEEIPADMLAQCQEYRQKMIESVAETDEELMEKLEEITNKLEKEQLSLDESVKLFEEGMQISKQCNSKLEDAEKRITMLINDNNEIKEENFIPEE